MNINPNTKSINASKHICYKSFHPNLQNFFIFIIIKLRVQKHIDIIVEKHLIVIRFDIYEVSKSLRDITLKVNVMVPDNTANFLITLLQIS